MKKITKMMCGVLGLGLLLTGCATVGNVKNKQADLIYNGNAAVMVDGYLYYGNSFINYKESISKDNDYKAQAKIGYLARLNTNIDLAANSEDYSPKMVENVANEVVAQDHSFMFALGNYIYYATPNRKEFSNENGKPVKQYGYTSLYRSKLNGDKKTKIYTTKSEVSQIEVLKFEGKYYVVIYAGNNLVKINIGTAKKAKSDVQVIAENVESVAIPKTYQKDKVGSTTDWNGQIYFTTKKTNENSEDVSGTVVNRIKINEKESVEMDAVGKTLKFVGRENDVVFYTNELDNGDVYSYVADVTGDNSKYAITRNNKVELWQGEISSVEALNSKVFDQNDNETTTNNGYLIKTSNNLKLAKKVVQTYTETVQGQPVEKSSISYQVNDLTFENEDLSSAPKVLDIRGNSVYLSASNSIYRVDLTSGNTKNLSAQLITKMTSLNDSIIAFDQNYVYYYAGLEKIESEEDEENVETDERIYLYRSSLSKSVSEDEKNYQILSKTKIKSRQSK